MNRISATARITVGLTCLTMSILLIAQTLGMIPDRRKAVMKGRATLCEAIAINSSLLASKNDAARMEASLTAIVERNADLLSAAVRREDGKILVEVGEHAIHWKVSEGEQSTDSYVYVPIMTADKLWGTVELRFQPLQTPGFAGYLDDPLVRLIVFFMALSGVVFYFYLRKMLRHLDPSKVVPDRVRSALDTLAEGLLVLDKDERIVLANQAFSKTVGQSSEKLQGSKVSELPWSGEGQEKEPASYPWRQSIGTGAQQMGVMLGLVSHDEKRTFKVNSSPIVGRDGEYRGALASFDDVTLMEKSRAELRQMLDELRESRDEIHRQNQELEILATRDPLTACLNRRSFFNEFETHWKNSKRHQHPLCCVMVDIDHFKSINDNHGHSVGDHVLQKVAEVLRAGRRDSDLVCRYGGEEFCILLPFTTIEEGCAVAENCRQRIESTNFSNLSITASLGVSAIEFGAHDPQGLLDQADKCLYVAKRNGRNQFVCWDNVPEDLEVDESQISRTKPPEEVETPIPFHAVTALISALAYRDTSTAEHSRRVADLCVAAARDMMSISDCYVLEIAALLHDIGKIGVPDAILLKPGPLTEEEWQIMTTHDTVGVEIIRAAFNSSSLTEIVESHHAWYGGNPRDADLPTGTDIPQGARLLSIADAYDAIISDRVYRKGKSQPEAFAELRRCAGKQFDPELVEHFIDTVVSSDSRNSTVPVVSKQTALRIGTQIERLASTLDSEDYTGLRAMASRLKATASKCGVTEVATLAEQLETLSGVEDPDYVELVNLTNDLLDVCRSTQRAYLADDRADGDEPTASDDQPELTLS